jgi:hypothetical protein
MSKSSVNAVQRSSLANSLALHDFANHAPDLRGWVDYTVGLFRKYGLEPTRMGITAPSIKSGKMNTYTREIKKLEKLDVFTIIGISIKATLNGSDDCHNDQIFTAIFNIGLKPDITRCVLTLDNTIASFEPDRWNNITQHMSAFFQPRYGYGYQRLYEKGPEWYPFGVCVGLDRDKDKQERSAITIWSNSYSMTDGKYRAGDMRDIYPLNILSSAHNQRMVGGIALFDWINADKSRGSLTKVGEDLWSWWLKDEDIDSVRAALKPTGILLCAP